MFSGGSSTSEASRLSYRSHVFDCGDDRRPGGRGWLCVDATRPPRSRGPACRQPRRSDPPTRAGDGCPEPTGPVACADFLAGLEQVGHARHQEGLGRHRDPQPKPAESANVVAAGSSSAPSEVVSKAATASSGDIGCRWSGQSSRSPTRPAQAPSPVQVRLGQSPFAPVTRRSTPVPIRSPAAARPGPPRRGRGGRRRRPGRPAGCAHRPAGKPRARTRKSPHAGRPLPVVILVRSHSGGQGPRASAAYAPRGEDLRPWRSQRRSAKVPPHLDRDLRRAAALAGRDHQKTLMGPRRPARLALRARGL